MRKLYIYGLVHIVSCSVFLLFTYMLSFVFLIFAVSYFVQSRFI